MISLWMCKNAIYHEGAIYPNDKSVWCAKGHKLPYIHSENVRDGKPLICKICQNCPDVDIMGEHPGQEDRGWID